MKQKDLDIKICELLTTKICHDLAGPLGAVNNGMELLKDGNLSMQDQYIELAEMSAKQAIDRLLFFRQAYGVTHEGSVVELTKFKELIGNYLLSINIDSPASFKINNNSKIDSGLAKIIYNLILLAAPCLIGNVKIAITIENSDNKKYNASVIATADNIIIADNIKASFGKDHHVPDLELKSFQAVITNHLARTLDAKVTLSAKDKMLSFQINN